MNNDEMDVTGAGFDSFAARAVQGRRTALEQLASQEGQASRSRAVMYLRVASSHQADASAIDMQREGCQRIAARHGLTVIREYVDVGRPAHLDQQFELQRLLCDLDEQRDVRFVVVWDYARLGRSMEQLDAVIQRIRSCGAEVATITGVEVVERFIRAQHEQLTREEEPNND